MKYIPLDEVKEILNTYSKWPLSMERHLDMFDKFNSLKTIDLSIINEMIEENEYLERKYLSDLNIRSAIDYKQMAVIHRLKSIAFQELKDRLSLNK